MEFEDEEDIDDQPDTATTPSNDDLEREVGRLQEELAEARRVARATPFSGEYLRLRDAVGRRDKEIANLREVFDRRGLEGQEERWLVPGSSSPPGPRFEPHARGVAPKCSGAGLWLA